MTCTNPQKIYVRKYLPIDFPKFDEELQHRLNHAKMHCTPGYHEIEVPCGRCLGCKLDRANEWATRLTLEMLNYSEACMMTFTYCPKAVPRTKKGRMTLYKRDFQLFIKKLRKYLHKKDKRKIKYFYCGEYGPTTHRPHYHAIIFGWKPQDLEFYKYNKHGDIIYKSKFLYDGYEKGMWGKGFCTIEDCNYNTACYVARYCTKKAGLAAKKREYAKAPKYDKHGKAHNQMIKKKDEPIDMYINMSIGIAKKYWLENMDFLKKWRYVELKVNDKIKHSGLCRYWKKMWKEDDWESYEIAKYEDYKKSIEKKQKLVEQDNFPKEWNFEKKWSEHLKKIEEKLYNHCRRGGILGRNDDVWYSEEYT